MKGKTISHIELRKSSEKFEIYVEIESKFISDWNSLQSFVETLNAIEVYPRQAILEKTIEGTVDVVK